MNQQSSRVATQPRKRHRDSSSNNTERIQENMQHHRSIILPRPNTLVDGEPQMNLAGKDENRKFALAQQQNHQQQIPEQQQQQENLPAQPFQFNTTSTLLDSSREEVPSPPNIQGTGVIDPMLIPCGNSTPLGLSPIHVEDNIFDVFSDFVEDWTGFDISKSLTGGKTVERHEDLIRNGPNSNEPMDSTIFPSDGAQTVEGNQLSLNQDIDKTNPMESALDRIMMLSVTLSKESRCARKHAMPGPRLKAVLNRTLEQSESFISLLKDLILLAAPRPNQEIPSQFLLDHTDSQPSNFSMTSRTPSTRLHIDEQAALQLLSCNAALLSNYDVIGSLLLEMVTTRAAENASILTYLPGVYMEGFSGVSSSLQVKLLTQVCVHMVLEMQTRLEQVRQGGMLAFTSLNIFDAIFGYEKEKQADQNDGSGMSRPIIQIMYKITKESGNSLG